LAQQSLQVLHNHLPAAVSNGQAAPTGPLPAEQNMSISMILPLRNQSELASLLGRLYDPSSPDYRHFLSVEQFTEQFGPTAEDYQAVVSFAQANGFRVTDTPANRLIVPITGTVAQINQAFNVTMNVYRHPTENRTFYSPDREPSLGLGVRVAHIAGLNSFSLPHPMIARATGGQTIANVSGSGPGGSYLGSDMRAAYYGGTTLTGTGQAVGVLEFGGYNLSDVNETFSNAGQSYSVPINNVLLDGATGAPVGDDGEQVLDIVQAIGMAPGLSQVRVYIGVGNDDAKIFSSMATENIAKQISVSWGWIPDDPTTDDIFFQEFAAQGQSVFVASGDSGALDPAISPYFYPAEDAYVTAVGATHLNTNGAGSAWVSETAWIGSGGGISPDQIAIPSWQDGVANTSNGGSATLRNEPDVAMEGDFDNYLCSIEFGCGGGVAGTSFAAPRWAGFMALVNQQAAEAGSASAGGTEPFGIVAAPFNKNGNPGLAVTSLYNGSVTVLLSQLSQTATATVSNLSPIGHGVHLADASYPGDSNYSSSVSTTVGLIAQATVPTVTVTPSPSSIRTTQPLTVTVAVSGGTGNPTPTGYVTLTSGSYTSAPATLSNGEATINVPAGSLTSGADSLTVSYTPDANSSSTYDSSTGSNSVTALAATSLTLSATPASSAYGQQVALSAVLSPYSAQGNNTNGEIVSFSNGGASLGSGTLSGGVATLTVTTLPIGTGSLTAAYAGDAVFAASGSNTLPYTVSPIAPAISFSVPNHTYGDAPFAVSAASTSPGAITYSVVSGPATVSGSTVTLTGAGAVVLQTAQAASGNFAAATQNAAFAVAVEPQTIAFAAPPSPINYGAAPISLSASASSGLAVTFSVLSGPGLVSGGTLTITGAGSVVVAADQAGSTNYAAAGEVTHSITVNKIAPSVGLTASPSPVLVQNEVTLTATVVSPAGTPTGSVAFSDGGKPLGTIDLNSGVATLGISTLATGSHSFAAVYSGDGNFNSVAGAAVSEIVQDFTLTTTSSSQTVQPGGAATYTFPVTPAGGTDLPAALAFSVSGLPTGFTATFNPASLAAGSPATTVTLTIDVPLTATLQRNMQPGKGLPLVALGMLLPWAGGIRRTRAWLRRLTVLVITLVVACGVATLIGCGGGGSSGGGGGTQSQTYNITVTATSGALVHSTTVTVAVQ
jgi:flavin reductase (DIM6/NTAB) family NADH-FMN oxidoreductase RutF